MIFVRGITKSGISKYLFLLITFWNKEFNFLEIKFNSLLIKGLELFLSPVQIYLFVPFVWA